MLAFGGRPGANDADETFFSFRVDDDHETSVDRADGDETVFELGVLRVEEFEIVGTRLEEPLGLRERKPCFRWLVRSFASSHSKGTRAEHKPLA